MGLEEHELRAWVHRIVHGEASRRQFIHTLLGLGLSGPVIADMLATYAPATAQDTRDVQQTFTPTRRGGWRDIAPAILAGPDDTEPPPRHWHQGPGGLAHRLRTVMVCESRWGTYPDPGGGDPEP